MIKKNSIIIAAIGEWNKIIFEKEIIKNKKFNFYLIQEEKKLLSIIKKKKPIFIFFIHWRKLVSYTILKRFNCICFHMTNLPYGRGGSPLQNLIVRNKKRTILTAFRMTKKFDAGPYLLKRPFELNGSAIDIYKRCSMLSWKMIRVILNSRIKEKPQRGLVTTFNRRHRRQSEIDNIKNINHLFDHIRMLDAPGYPKAFLKLNKKSKLVFKDAILNKKNKTINCNIFLK